MEVFEKEEGDGHVHSSAEYWTDTIDGPWIVVMNERDIAFLSWDLPDEPVVGQATSEIDGWHFHLLFNVESTTK